MKVRSWEMWNWVWCYSGLLPPGTVTNLGIKATQRKYAERRKGKGGKSWLVFSYQWEEQRWVQSQWRRGRRMAQQDPWSAAEWLPPCAWLTFLLCVTLLIWADSLFYRPGPDFCNTRHKGPLNSLEGTAIIWSRNCFHQTGKIEHFQSVILFLVKLLATWSFELQLLQF